MTESQRFEIDGVVYESIDDVPQPFRDSLAALMADRDGDGVPDVFEGHGTTRSVVHRTESYEIDGVSYTSLDDIPEHQRTQARQALARTHLDTTASSTPIVRSAGWSSRTKLIVTFVTVDLVALSVIAWFALR